MTSDGPRGIVKSGFRRAIVAFFEYDTPKIVHIRSKKVGFINRFIQLCILGYVIGYAIIWEKGYQEFDNIESIVTTKLKGVLHTDAAKLNISQIYSRTWDSADYVVPPQQTNAFFVTTNAIISPGQVYGKCDEDPHIHGVTCSNDGNCTKDAAVVNGNGVRTGKCVESKQVPNVRVCQVYAWCPVEVDKMPRKDKALLEEAANFTVLLKNQIEFPLFGKSRRNILETSNKTFLTRCHYGADDDELKYCPIFQLGKIVEYAGHNFKEMALVGGVIAINIHWECNLDFDIENCKPEYSFSRMDNQKTKISPGLNFRYANYYYVNGTQTRDLIKAYGIRFSVKVTGRAGKFSFVPLLLSLGSGMGLLAIATVLCDLFTLYLLKNGPFYKEKKYLNVIEDNIFEVADDEEIIEDPSVHRRSNYQRLDNQSDGE